MKATEFITNPDKDETVVTHTERFDGLLELNAEMRNTGQYFDDPNYGKHVANIPGIIIEGYCLRNGVSWAEFFADQKHIKAILNDPQFAYFRVAPGKV
jgi:hypothetical protein